MKKIVSISLVVLLLCQYTIAINASTSDEESHEKKGRKIHLHAEKFDDVESVYAVIKVEDGKEIEVQLNQCGKSEKSGQFTIRYEMEHLQEGIVAFIVNGYRQGIGADQEITLGKHTDTDHEDTGHEEPTEEGDESDHESSSCGGSDKGGKVTTDAALDISSDAALIIIEDEHDHEDGEKGALNYWLQALKTSYDVSVSVEPEDAVKVSNTGSYSKGEDVVLGFDIADGFAIKTIVVNDQTVENNSEYVIEDISEDVFIRIQADPVPEASSLSYRRTSATTYYDLVLKTNTGGRFLMYEGIRSYAKGTIVDVTYIEEEGYTLVAYSSESDNADIIDHRIIMNEDKYLYAIFGQASEVEEAYIVDILEQEILPSAEPDILEDEVIDVHISDQMLPQTSGTPIGLLMFIGSCLIIIGIKLK